ncbi:hypothetical protein ACFL45_05615 [Candidatus Neomarinimicrobiota bacterium]
MKSFGMAVVLVAGFIAGIGISGLLAGSSVATAVLAGGILPLGISVTSLAVFFSRRLTYVEQAAYQRFVVINFIIKMLFIGVWTAVMLLSTSLPIAPFVVSLLINFFVWHLFEAYRYQSVLKQEITRTREA